MFGYEKITHLKRYRLNSLICLILLLNCSCNNLKELIRTEDSWKHSIPGYGYVLSDYEQQQYTTLQNLLYSNSFEELMSISKDPIVVYLISDMFIPDLPCLNRDFLYGFYYMYFNGNKSNVEKKIYTEKEFFDVLDSLYIYGNKYNKSIQCPNSQQLLTLYNKQYFLCRVALFLDKNSNQVINILTDRRSVNSLISINLRSKNTPSDYAYSISSDNCQSFNIVYYDKSNNNLLCSISVGFTSTKHDGHELYLKTIKIYNKKGKCIRKYHPYHTITPKNAQGIFDRFLNITDIQE